MIPPDPPAAPPAPVTMDNVWDLEADPSALHQAAARWRAFARAADTHHSVVLNTGPGDDTVTMSVDPMTGERIVTVNGQVTRFPAGYDVTIRAGEGSDTIDVAPGTRVRLTLLGGAGDDTLSGGLGDDTLYGLSGADRIDGGFGQDYLEGGTGDDTLDGGAGNDMLSGGTGNARPPACRSTTTTTRRPRTGSTPTTRTP